MRILILLVSIFSLSAFASNVSIVPVDSQLEPESYVELAKLPLHTVVKPKPAPATVKKVPLEVSQRVQEKTQPHLDIKHHNRKPCVYHPSVVKHHTKRYVHHKRHKHAKYHKKNVLYLPSRRHRHLAWAEIYPGSLRWNVKSIAHKYGWNRVVWAPPEDYRWVDKTRLSAHGH